MVQIVSGCTALLPKKSIQEPQFNYEKISLSEEQNAHVVTINYFWKKVTLVQAKNPPLQTVSEIARRYNALMAVNAGFFAQEGYAVGALKIDQKWVSLPVKNRGVFGFDVEGNFYFDRLQRSNNSIKSEFSSHPWWENTQNIIGGAPLLILDGKILSVESEKTLDSFLNSRYARTAICVDKLKQMKIVVIDGGDRRSDAMSLSGGMTISELAQFMLNIGCLHALNLDGGYSSSLVVHNQRINKYLLESLPNDR